MRYSGPPATQSSSTSMQQETMRNKTIESSQNIADTRYSPQGMAPSKSPGSLAPDEREIVRVAQVDSSRSPGDRMAMSQSAITERCSPTYGSHHESLAPTSEFMIFLLGLTILCLKHCSILWY